MTGKRIKHNPLSETKLEQDRFLPVANVSRIMKKSLPTNAKISKDAKEIVQECVSEFISFITGEASDKCQREKRKTVNGDDLLWAMTTLGFENYVGPLKIYLNKYKESEGEKNIMARQEDDFLPTTQEIDEITGSSGNYFNLLGSEVKPKSWQRVIIGYRENLVTDAAAAENYEFDGNGQKALVPNLHGHWVE